jgi:cytochrome b561
MLVRNTTAEWGAIQQLLHWLVVIAVFAQLVLGFSYAGLPSDSAMWRQLFPIHTTLGLSIGLVMLLRLGWRLVNPVPLLPETLKSWQKSLARVTHWLLYLLLIGLPIGGYILVSTHGQPVPFYGWSLPPLMAVADNEPLRAAIWTMHAAGSFLVALLVLLHIIGALRHEWLLRDNVLRRMTPFFPARAEREKGQPSPALQHGRRVSD